MVWYIAVLVLDPVLWSTLRYRYAVDFCCLALDVPIPAFAVNEKYVTIVIILIALSELEPNPEAGIALIDNCHQA